MSSDSDVLIVGSGIMGAVVARLLREGDPALRITMIEAGRPIGDVPGTHLHDIADPAVWARYNEAVGSGIQGLYTGATTVRHDAGHVSELPQGVHTATAFGQEADAMPAAALAWNAGGMGVHWTAATPWPGDDEAFDFGDPARWAEDLETARRVLEVEPSPFEPTAVGRKVLDVLRRRYAGIGPDERQPQPMPMAVRATAFGPRPRTSPGTIFPPIAEGGDPAFALVTGTLVTALIVEGDRVTGVLLRGESELRAQAVVVCADALRTPQLLYTSGIRPEALGRNLNEHAFITSRVLVDIDRSDMPLPRVGEFATDSLWLPRNGSAQPFHGQIMNRTYVDDEGAPLAHSVGISLYVPLASRPENRLTFSSTETDLAGMPRIGIEFDYCDADRTLIDRALAEVRVIAEEFGSFDPATECALLPAGSSLHLTGTVRAGLADDGTSVCDPDGRVWGLANLYLAGNGVIPTAMAANVTLTGAVTAVRAARTVLAEHREEARA
ncbi:MAG TPA: GMC oxidoreductase [Actinospica sp.]|nr:GMC oxidoreductase [Actinospica sp.]